MVAIIGTGRWGTFQAWHFHEILGHDVVLVGRDNSSPSFQGLLRTRQNEFLTLPSGITLSCDAKQVISDADYVLIAIHSQDLRQYLRTLPKEILVNKKIILCMKGLEKGTGKRLSQVVEEEAPQALCGIFVGPGHVQELVNKIPTCQVVDSAISEYRKELQNLMSSKLIRVYEGNDIVGNEIGAALKNVIGLAAGYLDGLGLKQLKGALMARGCYEVGKITKALGGMFISAYGLAHLGDYEATLFSPHSNNRKYGEYIALQKEITWHAEGVETCEAICKAIDSNNIDAPIITSIYKVLFEGMSTDELLETIFSRQSKVEFTDDVL